MSDIDTGAPVAAEGGEPGIRILAQFIRDLSMENPRAPEALRPSPDQPQIDLGVEMNARGRDDGLFEVDLKLSAKANRTDGPLFIVERYGGVFQVSASAEEMSPCAIECPRYLFPSPAGSSPRSPPKVFPPSCSTPSTSPASRRPQAQAEEVGHA